MKEIQLEMSPEILGGRTEIRKNSLNYDQVVKIPLDKIVIREGFNARLHYGDIEELAASILQNGQDQPGRVDILKNGTFVLTDGHRRFKALTLLSERGNDCFFMAVVNKAKTTEEQRIIQMFTTQDNKKLEPVEVAELIRRLVNLGNKQKDVAKKIGKSSSFVSQMYSFAAENQQIKDVVTEGKMSVSSAIKVKRKIKSEKQRVQTITSAEANTPKSKKIDVKKIIGKSPLENKCETLAELLAERFDLNKETVLETILTIFK